MEDSGVIDGNCLMEGWEWRSADSEDSIISEIVTMVQCVEGFGEGFHFDIFAETEGTAEAYVEVGEVCAGACVTVDGGACGGSLDRVLTGGEVEGQL